MPKATTTKNLTRAPHLATGRVVAELGDAPARALYAAFQEFNHEFFGDKLGAPLVLITQAGSSRTLGDYSPRDVHGLESRIRIAPAAVKRGLAFAKDVLLHEMNHAVAQELGGDLELGYRGHGPIFAARCNAIGKCLNLPAVGVKGRDALPDCAHWPMVVRPAGYYPAPFVPPKRRAAEPSEPSELSEVDEPSADERRRERPPSAPPGAREWLAELSRYAVGRSAGHVLNVLGIVLSESTLSTEEVRILVPGGN